ncbi:MULTISPECIES: hypothetical protein [unclassified Streptomyces]|uniref:hypothetical protein n=1 Tax=unclassified Streptomyces TaxID=2593676 RepID=UPI001BE7DB83|nr:MULTISPECIES: hypothetical protein [unclassified Streptomyces]MBT2408525.1 hypothetical protein [Streptomyces sp. ISL-21]MBT2459692.1 hypothetical protein [Streptomyces sp. ISL-86]MBT2611962.1 hypothetical protein [Streptomyces sp. ISL-87]
MATTQYAAPASTARHRAPDGPSSLPGIPRQQTGSGLEAGRAPLFDQLAREWQARGATVPGLPDPVWDELISYKHFQRETQDTLRSLHLDSADPPPTRSAARPRWRRA